MVDANPFNMEDLVTPLDEDEIVNLEPVKIGLFFLSGFINF